MNYEFDGKVEEKLGKVLLVVSPPGSKIWPGDPSGHIAFGTAGDSGSLVYDLSGKAVGIYIGGQSNNNIGQVHNAGVVYSSSLDGIHFVSPVEPNLEEVQAIAGSLEMFKEYDSVEVNMLW